MNKILVLGNSGTGKSTFSTLLGQKTGIAVTHLDSLYFQLNGANLPAGEWERVQEELMREEKWIIDGNFPRTLDIRLRQADTVIFFNFPVWFSLYRKLKRLWQYRSESRPDMPDSFKEKMSWRDLKKVLMFNNTEVLNKIKTYPNINNLIVFTNPKDSEVYLTQTF